MGSGTCMFTLSENTSALKEFIISNSLKELTVGRNHLGIRLGMCKIGGGDESSLVPSSVIGP